MYVDSQSLVIYFYIADLYDWVTNDPGCPPPQNFPQVTWLQYESLPGPNASLLMQAPQLCSEFVH